MAASARRADSPASTLPFLGLSLALHAALLATGLLAVREPEVRFELPELIELGLMDDPGASGSPPPAAAAAPLPPAPSPPGPAVQAEARDEDAIAIDAGVAHAAPDAPPVADAGAPDEAALAALTDAAVSAEASGQGASPSGAGEGLGFGAGGFGSGTGGPLGAVIGLHADLDRIRSTSLVLEASALLEIIPEWQHLLQGSGLDPLADFSRVFVATPSLRRSQLVVSARIKGGEPAFASAVARLAHERGQPAGERSDGGVRTWPWHDRGPTDRVAGLFSSDQLVIAKPEDVGRVLAVSAALARRHAAQPGMEQAAGAAALLSMYENEAVALSVEGVRQFVEGDAVAYAPLGLRISLHHVDEFNAGLRAFAYYASPEQAAAAFERVEALRVLFAEHPRAAYLGLRSAIQEATFSRDGDTIVIESRLTMHQTRYLLGFVSRALTQRD
jgi:hypothetical protein